VSAPQGDRSLSLSCWGALLYSYPLYW